MTKGTYNHSHGQASMLNMIFLKSGFRTKLSCATVIFESWKVAFPVCSRDTTGIPQASCGGPVSAISRGSGMSSSCLERLGSRIVVKKCSLSKTLVKWLHTLYNSLKLTLWPSFWSQGVGESFPRQWLILNPGNVFMVCIRCLFLRRETCSENFLRETYSEQRSLRKEIAQKDSFFCGRKGG